MNSNTDTPGAVANAISHAEILQIATEAGMKFDGDEQIEALLQFADEIADRCASIVERYNLADGNAGADIRTMFRLG